MIREIKRIVVGQDTFDGAGVKLRRVFGFSVDNAFDPFLLLDDFGSDNPEDFLAGFPWHPHRGIEPVAWRGPIVMNTQAELDLAFREFHAGTFVK